MAITYPLDLPTTARINNAPRLLTFREANPKTQGGYPTVISLGVPLWEISYDTAQLTKAQLVEWEAWIDSLSGGIGYFKAIHPGRTYPVGRPQGYAGSVRVSDGSPFDGTGTIDSVSIPLSRIRLTGLPNLAGWAPGLTRGDVVSVALSSQGRQLFRVNANNVGTGTGFATIIDLVPSVNARIVNGAAYTIVDPWFEAQIVPGSLSIVDTVRERNVSFKAVQIIR